MKKIYVAPTAVAETFVANEYCSNCGITPDGKYIFTCDAAGGPLYYYKNGINRAATKIGDDYHPCAITHVTSSSSVPEYYEGFVDYNRNRKEDAGEHVLVWRGTSGTNGHATISLSASTIDVERS